MREVDDLVNAVARGSIVSWIADAGRPRDRQLAHSTRLGQEDRGSASAVRMAQPPTTDETTAAERSIGRSSCPIKVWQMAGQMKWQRC
jgi:hypothetical protein